MLHNNAVITPVNYRLGYFLFPGFCSTQSIGHRATFGKKFLVKGSGYLIIPAIYMKSAMMIGRYLSWASMMLKPRQLQLRWVALRASVGLGGKTAIGSRSSRGLASE